jgi:hypothetical protein
MSELAGHAGTGRKVRVTRNRPAEPLLNGYVVAASDRLAMLHPFHDFLPDGYSIIRSEDVVEVRQGEYERFWDGMLAGEGLLNGLRDPPWVDLTNMRAAIESLAMMYQCMIIQCEDAEETDQDFYIGRLLDASPEIVRFRHFNGLGEWDDEIAEIELGDITQVAVDTPYIRHFSKYVRAMPE